jgi:hypothetical protein
MHLLFNGYTSELAWINTVYQIIVYVIVGATAGALNKARPAATLVKAFYAPHRAATPRGTRPGELRWQ